MASDIRQILVNAALAEPLMSIDPDTIGTKRAFSPDRHKVPIPPTLRHASQPSCSSFFSLSVTSMTHSCREGAGLEAFQEVD